MKSAWKYVAAVAVLACAPALMLSLPTAALAQAATGASEAGNSIERIDAAQTGTNTVLTIQLKGAAGSVPPSFSVANPARIAIDLPQTTNNLGRNLVDVNQGDLRSVNVVQAQGRARVVLNLRRPVTHAISVDGNVITVALGANADTSFRAETAATTATPGRPAPAARPAVAEGPRSLRAVDFRRGSEGEGRVVVDLSDPNTSVDIRQQGAQIVVDFLNTALPDALRRRLDVSDFGTPVAMVNAVQQGPNVRVTIEPRGTVGAERLSKRHALRGRGQAGQGRPVAPLPGHAPGLPGRAAVAEFPERRRAVAAAGDRRLHQPEHHHQRLGRRVRSRCA
jgi:type IV pilus assembly protein PilQ